MKKIAFIAAGLTLALAASLPARADSFGLQVADAGVSIGVQIGTPPPPAPYEMVPAPRSGFVWAPGYWTWDGYRYVWVQRGPRWFYEPERWEEHRREERWEEHHHHHDHDHDHDRR